MTRRALCGCVPAALGAFDFGFLALAGPRLAPALGVDGDAYPWLFSASSFAYGAAVMPAAKLTARLGAVPALALGLAGVAAGTGTLAASSGLALTLAARAVTGVGGAIAATAAIALLAAIAREDERRAAFAALGGAVALGFAAGALAAGLAEWRGVLAAASVAAFAAALVAWRLPDRSADAARGAGHARRAGTARSPGTIRGAASGQNANARPAADPLPLRGGALLTAGIVCAAAGVAGADRRELWAIPLLALAGGLACVAIRRADGWLPPRRAALGAAAFAGAATTASGVGGTILIAAALTAQDLPGAVLGVFGLAVLPGSRLAARLTASWGAPATAATGLAAQALGLLAAAVALATGQGVIVIAVAVLVFGTGHVAANAGAAAAVADVAGPRASAVAGLLIAAQYVGGGIGPLVATAVATGHEPTIGVLVAAGIAIAGVLPIAALHLRASLSPAPGEAPS